MVGADAAKFWCFGDCEMKLSISISWVVLAIACAIVPRLRAVIESGDMPSRKAPPQFPAIGSIVGACEIQIIDERMIAMRGRDFHLVSRWATPAARRPANLLGAGGRVVGYPPKPVHVHGSGVADDFVTINGEAGDSREYDKELPAFQSCRVARGGRACGPRSRGCSAVSVSSSRRARSAWLAATA